VRRKRKPARLAPERAISHNWYKVFCGGDAMKVFVAAVLFAVIAAVGMSFVLNTYQRTSDTAFTTGGARVSEPGHNLIGKG
jgi:hypothetical protein